MSGASFTLPAAGGGSSGLSAQARANQIDKLFGRDIWFDVSDPGGANYIVTPSGDWKLAEGLVALKQSLIRRTITDPDEWPTLTDYGVGARQFVKSRNTRTNRDRLSERIRAQYLKDRRVESVESVLVGIEPTLVRIATVVMPKGRAIRTNGLRIEVEVS